MRGAVSANSSRLPRLFCQFCFFRIGFCGKTRRSTKKFIAFWRESNRFAFCDYDFGGAEIVYFDGKSRLRINDCSVLSDGFYDLAGGGFRLVCADGFARVRQQFAWGALWSAIFIFGTLHVFNPDDYIVRTNIRLMQEGRSFDAQYNSNLSDDGVPVLLENLPAMNFEQQCTIKWKLSRRLKQAKKENDFRSWNLSRWQTRRGINEIAESLDTSNCPGYTKSYNGDF